MTDFSPSVGFGRIEKINIYPCQNATTHPSYHDVMASVIVKFTNIEHALYATQEVAKSLIWVASCIGSGYKYRSHEVSENGLPCEECDAVFRIVDESMSTPPMVAIEVVWKNWSPRQILAFQDMLAGVALAHGIPIISKSGR